MSSSKCQVDKAFFLKEFNPNHSLKARNGYEMGCKTALLPGKIRLTTNNQPRQTLTLQWR